MDTRVYVIIGLILVAASTAIIIVYLFDLIRVVRRKKRTKYYKCPVCEANICHIPGSRELKYCPCCGEKLKEEDNGKQS